jgi:hypothetical protein
VTDETLGERVGLVVYPKNGRAPDLAALRDFMADRLAGEPQARRAHLACARFCGRLVKLTPSFP